MRSALSILGLVIVFAIVMLSAKKQMQALPPPASSASSSGQATPGSGPVRPEAVGRQVQDLMKQGEGRASEADQ